MRRRQAVPGSQQAGDLRWHPFDRRHTQGQDLRHPLGGVTIPERWPDCCGRFTKRLCRRQPDPVRIETNQAVGAMGDRDRRSGPRR